LRESLKRIAFAIGAGPTLRKARRALDAYWLKRDRLYNEHLKMLRLLAFVLSRDSNCIDVGAGEGSVLKEIVRLAPNGRHIAYEPIPQFYEKLIARFPAVDVRRTALSNARGESEFTFVRNHPYFSGLRERTYPEGKVQIEKLKVQTEDLDSSLPKDYSPTFIKVDVEGAEQAVFEGAIKTITTHKPLIVFEHGKGAADHYGRGPRDVYSFLVGHAGFRIFDLDGKGPYSVAEFEKTFDDDSHWNFVARP
jgi:FkbM family methyltransferase